MAERYAEAFPSAYLNALERHVVTVFAGMVGDALADGVVVDIGCGTGHVTADLAAAGLPAIGVDPSSEMLRIARRDHPELTFLHDDAMLGSDESAAVQVRALVARFSLIHIPPERVPVVVGAWAARLPAGGLLLVTAQASDHEPVLEFDHFVAPAWRWHPDHLSDRLSQAGFDEAWRTLSRPDEQHRFPEVHLVAKRRPHTTGPRRAPDSR